MKNKVLMETKKIKMTARISKIKIVLEACNENDR
jgi:hypothetical protein